MEKVANIQTDVSDIKTLLTCHVDAQTKFEQETVSSRLVAAEKMTAVQAKVDDHEKRLIGLEDIVRKLAITDAILRWVAVILMTSVIALIWGVVTHQVTLGFP